MVYGTLESRQAIVGLMQEIVKAAEPELQERLHQLMNPAQIEVQQWVDQLGFDEGAWYRPPHNKLVPAAMIAISARESFPRSLVLAAQVHDAGNSQMKIQATTDGAAWENVGKRWGHMGIGAGMFATRMEEMLKEQRIELTKPQLAALYTIIATHDFPYLGIPFDTPDLFHPNLVRFMKAHRDADRLYVMSASSFWKDLAAHFCDASYHDKAAALGITVNPTDSLRARLAFFYESADQLPEGWNQGLLPFNAGLAPYNEGGVVEPMHTKTGEIILANQFMRRASELEEVIRMETPQQFGDMFEKAFKAEMYAIMDYAEGDDSALDLTA